MRQLQVVRACTSTACMKEELGHGKILASNGKLHRAMRETITKAWPEADRRQAQGRAAP